MIGQILGALGLGDQLPRSHANRVAELSARTTKIENQRASETDRLQAALVAAREKAAADTAAEQERFEAHARQLADDLAAAFVPAFAPLFAAWRADDRRPSLLALAEPLRDFNARSHEECGCELQPLLVAAAAACAIVGATPKAASAFTSADSLTGDAISSAARLLRAAVSHSDAATLEVFAYALEAALQKAVRYNGGREVTDAQREAWGIVVSSGRASDRADRLAKLAEKHGAARQKAFEAGYTPADHVIVSHVRQPEAL